MRKLLLSSVVLSIFAISLTVFQMSCQKEVTAQQTGTNYSLLPATTTTLGGVIVGNGLSVTSNGTLSLTSMTSGLTQLNKIVYDRFDYQANKNDGIWIANYDGTNQTKINITVAGYDSSYINHPKLSPDGKTIFFIVHGNVAGISQWHIYSANIDGTNVKKIIDGGNGKYEFDEIGGAY